MIAALSEDSSGMASHNDSALAPALVKTAVGLSDEQQLRISEALSKRFHRQVQARFEVDPTIIGGVWARVGDEVVDDSIARRLAELHRQLTRGKS